MKKNLSTLALIAATCGYCLLVMLVMWASARVEAQSLEKQPSPILTELETAKRQIIYWQDQLRQEKEKSAKELANATARAGSCQEALSHLEGEELKRAAGSLDEEILKGHKAEGGRVDWSSPQARVVPPAPKEAKKADNPK